MATARERLRQLTIGQEEAQDLAMSAKEAAKPEEEPTGGDILSRPIRPSEAGQLDPGEATPFEDFGEFFLNQIGISSERQRRSALETLMAENEANRALINSAKEHVATVAKGGTTGPNETDRFRESQLFLENGIKLIDNPNPNIRAIGRTQIQSGIEGIDSIIQEREDVRDIQRTRIQGRVDNLTNALLGERQNNDDVIALVNSYAESNGANAQLPITIKQKFGEYLGNVSFGSPGQQTIFGVPIAFDPSDSITAGNALAMVADVSRKRQATIVNQISGEVQTGSDNGFTFNEKDGRLSVNEILIPALGPETENFIKRTPSGGPMTIQPGLPTQEQTDRAGRSIVNLVTGVTGGIFGETNESVESGILSGPRRATTDALEFLFGPDIPPLNTPSETNREKFMRTRKPGLFQPGGFFDREPKERETN